MHNKDKNCRIHSKVQTGIRAAREFALAATTIGLFLFASTFHGHAASGDLDPSFGIGGRVVTKIGSDYDRANAIAIQSDGKIIAAGISYSFYYEDFAIARYNVDGSLDTSFGTGGKVVTPIGIKMDSASAVAIQSDGKIVVAGTVEWNDCDRDCEFALIRYNVDGAIDTSFGVGGVVLTRFATRVDATYSDARAIAIQTDGKIIAVGSMGYSFYSSAIAVARYNTNGSLDTSFGANGLVTTEFSEYGADGANAVVVQPNGKFVVAGSSYAGTGFDFALVRYDSNGSPDTSFGTGGKVLTSFGSEDSATDLASQADGKIVVVGYNRLINNFRIALARYNTNGSLDDNFGTGGKIVTPVGNSYYGGNAVAIQSNGKIAVASVAGNPNNETFALVRYNPNGSLDTHFGSGGIVSTEIEGYSSIANAVAIQSDGKIIAAGSATGETSEFALVRLMGDPRPASNMSVSGRVMAPDGRGLQNAKVVITDPRGFGRTATTSSFGYFTLENVPAGETYLIGVSSRRYRFASRNLIVNDNLTNVDFVGLE